MTNSTTETLDDDAIAEIEARHSLAARAFQPYKEVSDSLSDIPALCATVRALRERLNEETQYAAGLRHRLVIADGVYNEKGEYTRYAQTAINRATDQLQSQLEQVTKERDEYRKRLLEKVKAMRSRWHDRYVAASSDSREALVQKELLFAKCRAASEIITALESVSIQEQEQHRVDGA